MKLKVAGLAILSFVALTQTHCGAEEAKVARQVGSIASGEQPGYAPSPATLPDEGRVQSLISSLPEGYDGSQAQAELIRLAGQSPAHRELVIKKLIVAVGGLDLEGKLVLDVPTFGLWSRAAQIFGSLQATEAIDLLIRFIYCGNGLSSASFRHRPAEGALVAMGNMAVPKLSEALTHNGNPVIRRSVAECLANIGGPESKNALERALETESDPNVIHTIKLALAAIAREAPVNAEK